ncbi:hypothetical protein NFX46_18275 [Streptomyces phaeoluteigriseus]|uniref:alpha-L-rhamnosidase n=1 Tax=Streptomyces phaeoluteigriseus TaxID=114686 RepID=A0ABY4ZKU6_9ACTN|nr:alpha-L-rhamnosidase C-terminal domain-containing protein [Streptomyces phaeoluteigriseus]USQ89616.1 hypothetical protein NFX46_18275 [Streptomyces phaeoluteigriseus]
MTTQGRVQRGVPGPGRLLPHGQGSRLPADQQRHPLAFGLVPDRARAQVFAGPGAGIEARGNHLDTGALGTSVLCQEGRADLAHAIATQRTYPGWGCWHDNGADTMWEMWPPDSRSRDHYFQGTVAQWLYENVAGLRPGDVGYARFSVRPDPWIGVDWARTSIRTVRGRGEPWVSPGRRMERPSGSTCRRRWAPSRKSTCPRPAATR